MQSSYFRRKTNKNHWREAWNPRLSVIAKPRRKAWSSHLNITAKPRRGARSPRLSRARHPHLNATAMPKRGLAKLEARVQQSSMAKCETQARISTASELRVSVVTALITGSVTSHVMRGVNPHYGGSLGDSFTLKTLINNLVCYWRGVRIFSWGILIKS